MAAIMTFPAQPAAPSRVPGGERAAPAQGPAFADAWHTLERQERPGAAPDGPSPGPAGEEARIGADADDEVSPLADEEAQADAAPDPEGLAAPVPATAADGQPPVAAGGTIPARTPGPAAPPGGQPANAPSGAALRASGETPAPGTDEGKPGATPSAPAEPAAEAIRQPAKGTPDPLAARLAAALEARARPGPATEGKGEPAHPRGAPVQGMSVLQDSFFNAAGSAAAPSGAPLARPALPVEAYSEASALPDSASAGPGLRESPQSAPPGPGTSGQPIPDLPRHIARQMAALPPGPNQPTEVRLNPEELGRVRMTMVQSEHAITVTITAERSDTLDLMRRHIGLLAEEFRQIGYTEIRFDFGSGFGGQGERPDTPGAAGPGPGGAVADGPDMADLPPPSLTRRADGSIDIRL